MAEGEAKNGRTRGDREDETALAPLFAEARDEEPVPRAAFVNAIIADAAEVQAAREATAVRARAPGRQRGRVRAPLLGWASAAALAACVAAGFVAGLAGGADFGAALLGERAEPESPAEAVGAFFDLASVEG